jgi:hypothetical protein
VFDVDEREPVEAEGGVSVVPRSTGLVRSAMAHAMRCRGHQFG